MHGVQYLTRHRGVFRVLFLTKRIFEGSIIEKYKNPEGDRFLKGLAVMFLMFCNVWKCVLQELLDFINGQHEHCF